MTAECRIISTGFYGPCVPSGALESDDGIAVIVYVLLAAAVALLLIKTRGGG